MSYGRSFARFELNVVFGFGMGVVDFVYTFSVQENAIALSCSLLEELGIVRLCISSELSISNLLLNCAVAF